MTPEPAPTDDDSTDPEASSGSTDGVLRGFEAGYGFPLDDFQVTAVTSLLEGRSVLLAAPTGAGKTVVGEFACWQAIQDGTKCFYTTPIKALSNQKFRDLQQRHGEANVGLLTGDRSVNGEAPLVVMTTEVLRNMIYEASTTLSGLRYVVLDEVHYLADVSRGAVWEEVIIQLPRSTQIAALSATVSNAEEFGEWLAEARDGCDVVIEERRPVPLRHHYWVNDRIYPTFRTGKKKGADKAARAAAREARGGVPNPDVIMLERNASRGKRVTKRGRRVSTGRRLRWPSRGDVIHELHRRDWLPAIVFVFSRAGCEDAVQQLMRSGVPPLGKGALREVHDIVESCTAEIPDEDLAVLGYGTWLDALQHGVAAHHAGMVPAFKEAVEACFQAGLLRMVVATETLALGINMPAKTVVIERLEKWNGERHVMLTPGQYTQLTGRAGRRGIDPVGHAIVLYQRDIDFREVAGLVGTRTYPLSSSFEPSYNMAVNLLRRRDRDEAETILEASFAQFQTELRLRGQREKLTELEAGLDGYGRNLHCDEGDWAAYWALRREVSRLEKEHARQRHRGHDEAVNDALAQLQPGDVVALPFLANRALAAVVGVQLTKGGNIVLQIVAEDRALSRVGPRELDTPPVPAGHIDLPERGNPRQSEYREIVASRLRRLEAPPRVTTELDVRPEAPAEIERLHTALRAHPCHHCEHRDEHERWQYRADDVTREATQLREQLERQGGSLVRQFERIIDVLTELGYLLDGQPTEQGMRLAGIYSEVDLLVAECLRQGAADGLTAEELAGLAAYFVYEPRGGDPTPNPEIPTPRLVEAIDVADTIAGELRARERRVGLDTLRELDAGFVAPAYRWAHGLGLDDALGDLDITGGDFVRNVKQVADLVGQLRDVGDHDLRSAARTALDELRRGIVEA